MTLAQVIDLIKECALAQPAVQIVVENDPSRLNHIADARYGAFMFVQREHRETIDGLITYSFSFIYADRLTGEPDNEIAVQSVGIRVLSNILRALDERGLHSDAWNFTTFRQRFTDLCAGAFCNVDLETEVDYICNDKIDE